MPTAPENCRRTKYIPSAIHGPIAARRLLLLITIQIVKINGSATTSSLERNAAKANMPATTPRSRNSAIAASTEKSVPNSDVRPLSQTIAMLMPWKLNAHTAVARIAAHGARPTTRARR